MDRNQFPQIVEEFQLIRLKLLNEVHVATKCSKSFAEDAGRRVIVRSCFACIEGVLYAFKQILLDYDGFRPFLKPEERVLMDEVCFEVNDKGEVGKRNAHIRLADNIRFTLNMWSRIKPEPKDAIDYGAQGWCKLREAIVLRNRVTHPKSQIDLAVSEEDVQGVLLGHNWFLAVIEQSVDPLRTLAARIATQ